MFKTFIQEYIQAKDWKWDKYVVEMAIKEKETAKTNKQKKLLKRERM